MRRGARSALRRWRGASLAAAALMVLSGCAGGTVTISAPQLTGSSTGPDLNWNFCQGGDPAADYNCSGSGN
jgi:hypothetical protein